MEVAGEWRQNSYKLVCLLTGTRSGQHKRLHLTKVERNPNVSFDFHMHFCCGSCMPTLIQLNVHTHTYTITHKTYTPRLYKLPYDLANPTLDMFPKEMKSAFRRGVGAPAQLSIVTAVKMGNSLHSHEQIRSMVCTQ